MHCRMVTRIESQMTLIMDMTLKTCKMCPYCHSKCVSTINNSRANQIMDSKLGIETDLGPSSRRCSDERSKVSKSVSGLQ